MRKNFVVLMALLLVACVSQEKPKNFETQFAQHQEKIEQSCDNPQDRKGCQILEVAYLNGWGVEKDERRAVFYAEQACNAGFLGSCFNLGLSHQKGKGVPRDYKKVVDFYTKACNGNHAKACNNLGVLYNRGFGVERNRATALRYFHKACQIDRNLVQNNNESYGCTNLR